MNYLDQLAAAAAAVILSVVSILGTVSMNASSVASVIA